MYARTITIAATGDPVKLASGDRIPAGWYMFRAGFNPADTDEYGGVVIALAASGVHANSAAQIELNPTEAQVVALDEPTEVLITRAGDTKVRVVITEV